jgi:hypothetical protein
VFQHALVWGARPPGEQTATSTAATPSASSSVLQQSPSMTMSIVAGRLQCKLKGSVVIANASISAVTVAAGR